jgi:DNA-binding NarL/FixJ family response regulator
VRIALEEHGFIVCAEVADAASAVEAAKREQPELCLLDIQMPGGGIKAAHEISAQVPGAAIVMLTVSESEEDVFAALRAGAAGYLLKDMDPARLGDALSGVLAGEAAMPRRLTVRVFEEFSERQKRRVPLPSGGMAELSAREWETLELLRVGHSTGVVAERMGISQVTVRRHVFEALRKLKVPNREAALELLQQAHAGLTHRNQDG